MNKQLKSKSDLVTFIKSVKPTTVEGQQFFSAMKSLLHAVTDKHGRSNEAREAVKQAEIIRKKLVLAETPKSKQAPKKKAGARVRDSITRSAKKSTKLSDEEKAARKAAREKARAETLKTRAIEKYGDDTASNGKFCCLCGCGEETPTIEFKNGSVAHKLFVQGHDAKLKGKIQLVVGGFLPKRVLSVNALQYASRWALIHEEQLAVLGEERLEWDTEDGSRPKTMEVFYDVI